MIVALREDVIGGTWYVRGRIGDTDCLQRLPADPKKWDAAFKRVEMKAEMAASAYAPYTYGGVHCGFRA